MSQQSPLAAPLPWNLVSTDYAHELVPFFERFSMDAAQLAGVRAGSAVLDVASGPGTFAFVAAREGAKVTAVDFAEHMIAQLRARAAREGVATIHARVGDGQALEEPDASFDAAVSMFGLIFFPDRARGLRELHRVLRPGGRALVSSWAPLDRVPFMRELFAAIRAELPGLPFGEGKAPLGTEEEVREELTAAGFRDVEVHERTHVVEADSLVELWGNMQRTNAPLVLLREKLGAEAFAKVASGVFDRLRATYGEGPQRAPMTALLGVGTR